MKKIIVMLLPLVLMFSGSALATDVTFTDKVTGGTFTAADANQIKAAVNSKRNKSIPSVRTAVNYTVGTNNPDECYGGIVYATAPVTITACAGLTDGMEFAVAVIGHHLVSVDVQSYDRQILDGITLDNGDKATSNGVAGARAHYTYESADGWFVRSMVVGHPDDHWTDGGP